MCVCVHRYSGAVSILVENFIISHWIPRVIYIRVYYFLQTNFEYFKRETKLFNVFIMMEIGYFQRLPGGSSSMCERQTNGPDEIQCESDLFALLFHTKSKA